MAVRGRPNALNRFFWRAESLQQLRERDFSDITPTSHQFEQAFSNDGGRTWEPNFVARLTRAEG